jgi:hypothetical protein
VARNNQRQGTPRTMAGESSDAAAGGGTLGPAVGGLASVDLSEGNYSDNLIYLVL